MIKDRGAFENNTFSFDVHSTPSLFQHGGERRVIFVTNRGPIEHQFAEDGTPVAQCGAGGVVSGLLCAARGRPVSWISVAMTDADRALAQPHGDAVIAAPCGMDDLTARLVYIPPKTYSRYYDSVSNRLLWFAQHGLPHERIAAAPSIRQHWERGYVAVNQALADAVLADMGDGSDNTSVMFHDYHLYLAPKMVRDRAPAGLECVRRHRNVRHDDRRYVLRARHQLAPRIPDGALRRRSGIHRARAFGAKGSRRVDGADKRCREGHRAGL